MFTINGNTAYTRAFALCHQQTKAACTLTLMQRLEKAGSNLPRLARAKFERRYPVELKPMLDENPRSSPHRPLWLFHVARTAILTSPKDEAATIEGALIKILGKNIGLIDLHQARSGLKKICATFQQSLHSPFDAILTVPKEELSAYQIAQLLMIGKGSLPKSIKLEFVKNEGAPELFGYLRFQDGMEPKKLHLCFNFRPRRLACQPESFDPGRVNFVNDRKGEQYKLHDMVFELNPALIA